MLRSAVKQIDGAGIDIEVTPGRAQIDRHRDPTSTYQSTRSAVIFSGSRRGEVVAVLATRQPRASWL